MGRTKKFVDGCYTPSSTKDAGNELLSHFGFKSTWRKGKKGGNFPVMKAGRPCKAILPGIPIKIAANKEIIEVVAVFPYEDDGKEGCANIVKEMTREDDRGSNNPISDMDEEALTS